MTADALATQPRDGGRRELLDAGCTCIARAIRRCSCITVGGDCGVHTSTVTASSDTELVDGLQHVASEGEAARECSGEAWWTLPVCTLHGVNDGEQQLQQQG
jgi:hypothetical protein